MENLTNIQVEVSVSSPEVAIADPIVSFPDLSAGSSAAGLEPLVLDIHPAYLCDEEITVVLRFTSDQGAWEDAFQLPVGDHFAEETGTILEQNFNPGKSS